jgi:hypothetical protein
MKLAGRQARSGEYLLEKRPDQTVPGVSHEYEIGTGRTSRRLKLDRNVPAGNNFEFDFESHERAPPISILQTSSRSMIVHSGDSGDKSIEYELHVRRCEINDMTTKGRRSDSSGMARYSAGRR